MAQKYCIKTFGCAQNVADSERIASFYESRGYEETKDDTQADTIVINTCVIRGRAEEKVYGMVRNLQPLREKNPDLSIVITGCLIGAASREPSGKMMKALRKRVPHAQLLPLDEVGFEYAPKRTQGKAAFIPISNGCNNFCAYCIVPFSRGKERSRTFDEIAGEVFEAVESGCEEIVLLGQNVNSYGADFLQEKIKEGDAYTLPNGENVKPVMVKHLNRHRIPTLFPQLLEYVATVPGVKKVTFLSSNPWDFSDELIAVMARQKNIDRRLHLPVQAGSDAVLKAMNRWYTRDEYVALVDRIRKAIPEIEITTDIIVGFPGETDEQFEDTMDLARKVGFAQAYIAWYSPRPGTSAATKMQDDVPFLEKKRRFKQIDDVVCGRLP
ncbi:MAG: MiaB/RimO family radical SAM methylthiotransferase [Candidatus Moranbacteria bacterium]|nr:MiaB/RimO family radical SAM methylthiotransferase [Candidatus Moranbacteria bacterium]